MVSSRLTDYRYRGSLARQAGNAPERRAPRGEAGTTTFAHRSTWHCRALADSGNLAKLTAKDVMTKDVVCCSPDDDIQVAIETMEAKQIRRLPVTDSHKIMIGMLSLGDISHKVSKDLSGEMLRAVSGHHV